MTTTQLPSILTNICNELGFTGTATAANVLCTQVDNGTFCLIGSGSASNPYTTAINPEQSTGISPGSINGTGLQSK